MSMILRRVLPGLLLAAWLAAPAMAQNRVATIDLRKVFDNYWKKPQAEAALKERGAELDKDYKGLIDDYTKTKEDYNKLLASANDQSVTTEEREKRKSAAEAKFQEIRTSENMLKTFEADARDKLDTQKKRMRESILQDIRTAVNAKAKTASYTLVIDSAAISVNDAPVVLYTNGENDLTDAILAQLNATAPPSAAATKGSGK